MNKSMAQFLKNQIQLPIINNNNKEKYELTTI